MATAGVGSTFPAFLMGGVQQRQSSGVNAGSSEIQDLLKQRDDLKMEDLTVGNGSRLNPILNDPDSRQALLSSRSITPRGLAEMQSQISQSVKDPAFAKSAYRMALEALSSGQDVQPQALGRLFSGIMDAVGKKPETAAIALSMFASAKDHIKSGKTPDDLLGLVKAATQIGGGEGSKSALSVANAFDTAASSKQPPQEVAKLASVLSQRFPGKDNSERIRAFDGGLQLMSRNPSMRASTVDKMLAEGAGQGLRGEKLLKNFGEQSQALHVGHMTLPEVGDKNRKTFKPTPNMAKMSRLPNILGGLVGTSGSSGASSAAREGNAISSGNSAAAGAR